MGLAASQGRYLCLTARMSDLVFEGQQISQQRLNLAQESQEIADKYNNALSNTKMTANVMGETVQLTYGVITDQDPLTGLCMRIVDCDGNIVAPSKKYSLDVTEDDKTTNYSSSVSFINKYMTDLNPDEASQMSLWSIDEVADYYKKNYSNSNITLNLKSNLDDIPRNENERFVYDDNCNDPRYLQEMLTNGSWFVQQYSSDENNNWNTVNWQGTSSISEVSDTSDDAAAEAEYEAATKDIQRRDKILELRLEQVQTEEKSVEKEMDSVKNTISKNVESSFGTFA